MLKNAFSRELRLLISSEFTFVFQKAQRVSTSYMIILGRLNTIGHPRIGLTISKKHVKLAHERNRIKRIMRESFRLHQHVLPTIDFVIIAKKNVGNLNNHALTTILKKLWHCYYY